MKRFLHPLLLLLARATEKELVQTVEYRRVLLEHGFDPGPKRGRGTWHEFIQRHVKTLWATDFFTKTVWTLRGPVTYYVLFFIHLHTRRVHVAGMTPSPDGTWMAQIARNMSMTFAEEPAEFRPTHVIRDRDTKFTAQFCSILETDGLEFRPIPARSPNLNPYCESWVGRTRAEVLNHFIVFGEGHLRHILDRWLVHYHFQRPHQGLGHVPIGCDLPPPETMREFCLDDVVCHESLGGLLKHFERRAA
jgi:putative transposase